MFEATYSLLGMRNFPVSMSYLGFLTAEALRPSNQVSRMAAANILAAVEDSQKGVAHQSVIICDKVLGVDWFK